MINAIIVDDEQDSIDTLKVLVDTFLDQVEIVGTATDINTAYTLIKKHEPELVFLDIEMGTDTGFDLLELFDDTNFHLVFVTAHEKFALRAIRFSALDYIVKPVSPQDLKRSVARLQRFGVPKDEVKKVKHMFTNLLTENRGHHRLSIPTLEGFEFVKIADILYCKADGSYSHIYLKNKEKLTTSKNLKYYAEILSEYGFYRIHSATLINLMYLKKFGKSVGGYVIMEDGSELSVSKSRKNGLLEVLSLNA
jgi:two-component system LytT family response regulator